MQEDGARSRMSKNDFKVSTPLALVGGTVVLFTCLSFPFVLPGFRKIAIPWMTTPKRVIREALDIVLVQKLKSKKQNIKMCDLGSGDGRTIIAAALHNKQVVVHGKGYELNPWLVAFSYFSAFQNNVLGKCSFSPRDFFKADISDYDVISVFGVAPAMQPLSEKLMDELDPGKKVFVITYRFPLPSMVRPFYESKELYIYEFGGETK